MYRNLTENAAIASMSQSFSLIRLSPFLPQFYGGNKKKDAILGETDGKFRAVCTYLWQKNQQSQDKRIRNSKRALLIAVLSAGVSAGILEISIFAVSVFVN